MAPVPIDGHQPQGGTSSQQGGGTISLAVLIDFLLQRSYHELTVLSELLPRKIDLERKIEIVQFANRTRQLFVRLLALVKWANSASKVDKCAMITSFLDQQSLLFVDTADLLARMSRETLVHARLPTFHIPSAVDVLVTGSYPRIPACIRERIVPADPITTLEKRSTLSRLNQIIQHRIVTNDLPCQMRNLKVEHGGVTFHIEHEFEVSLTLMGDGANIPWRLLDIDILVEDKETGDGKSLVHPLQVQYLHQLVQSRLIDNDKPLHDLYNTLHSFCQSLQLEVLHSQVIRLLRERLGEYIRIEEYTAGKCLVLAYWREIKKEGKIEFGPGQFKLCVQVDPTDCSQPLQISHTPPISSQDSEQVDEAIKSDHLSVERLLVHAVHIRAKSKLLDLKSDIENLNLTAAECLVGGSPVVLRIPIFDPCLPSEQLIISVDILSGALLVSLPHYDNCRLIDDLEVSFNEDKNKLEAMFLQLRYSLMLRRCEKTMQHLPAICVNNLPLVGTAGHPISELGPHTLYTKLTKHPNSYIITELKVNPDNSKIIEPIFHLLTVKPVCLDDVSATIKEDSIEPELPKPFLKPVSMVLFDVYSTTHGPNTKVSTEEAEGEELISGRLKRKHGLWDTQGPAPKKPKPPPYFIPELAHVVALSDEKIPFLALSDELTRQNICHQGVQVESLGCGMVLTLVTIPNVPGYNAAVSESLKKNLLSCSFRLQGKGTRSWQIAYMFANCPLRGTNMKEQGAVHPVYSLYDSTPFDRVQKIVEDFLSEWTMMTHLYGAVLDFAAILEDPQKNMNNIVEVKSFNYKKLILVYGPNKISTVVIQWKVGENQFHLSFGTCGQGQNATNPHCLVAVQLQHDFNQHHSIAQLVQVLHETFSPLNAISKLSAAPMMGMTNRPQLAVQSFSVLPQSATHFRIAFRGIYCIDMHCRSNNVVGVRDGAYSLFDKSKVIEGFTPTQGLKAFLSMFVDESVKQAKRISVSEDDNPPSPVGMDTMESFMSQHHKPSSPAQREGLRFHPPLTPPSNPHTPASPHTSVLQQQASYTSSPAGPFSLASPPSFNPNITPSPSMVHMGTPSPGNLLAAGSPGSGFHVPSPGSFLPTPSPSSQGVHMQSPASTFIGPQDGGSPFASNTTSLAMPSPGARNWPGSPSVPGPSPASRHGTAHSPGNPALHSPPSVASDHSKSGGNPSTPSRKIPQRSWAAAVPTDLSHEAFNVLCTPSAMPGVNPSIGLPHCSPLERFLGCVYMRRHLQRVVQLEECLTHVQSNEPGLILFRVESLQCTVALNPNNLQMLHLKVTPQNEYKDQWNLEELQILERFFDTKVACYPYKANALSAFGHILGAPLRILKDCIQLLRLELAPERSFKWSVQWCLTIPPAGPHIAPTGTAAVVIKSKMLFFIQLTRIGLQLSAGTEPQSIILPIVYDLNSNITQMADPRTPTTMPPTAATSTSIIISMLKRFTEYNLKPGDCSLFPAIRELITNLVIPI